VNTAEFERGEIASFLKRNGIAIDLWERGNNSWTHYSYQMTPEEVMEYHDKQIPETTIRHMASLAFVPPQIDRSRLILDSSGEAYLDKQKFDSHFDYISWPNPSLPEQIFWGLA
jgi:hypothetical protein